MTGIKFMIKSLCSSVIAKQGRRVTRYPLAQYLRDRKIDTVLDIGANTGQFAEEIRNLGFRGNIHSFEPLPKEFEELRRNSEGDKCWEAHNFALGAESCFKKINISANSPSSSFLPVSAELDTGLLNLATVASVTVEIKRLDDVLQTLISDSERTFYLKIDTQGFERQVIDGAANSLRNISMVQMELGLIQNYEGESLIEEMVGLMRSRGFVPWWIIDGYRNNTNLQLYQVDVFFANSSV